MADWREDRAGMAAMLRTPSAVNGVRRVGELIEAEAVRISPVQTGRYVNNWYVHADVDTRGAFARVGNSARSDDGFNYPAALEFGTKNMRRQRILGRALDAVNLA